MDLVIGRVVKTHGIRGEVVVDIRTDEPDLRFAPGSTLTGRRPRSAETATYTVESVRPHSGRLLIRLDGIADRAAADALRGTLFVVDSATLPPSEDPDEFYDHELEGLRVRTVAGDDVGVIAEVLHSAAGELLAVRTPEGREVLVPFVRDIVPEVALADGIVTIDPPEGLLDL